MTATAKTAKEIFVELVACPAQEWEERLASACGGDEQLRRRVQSLLAAHREQDSFLIRPADPDIATLDQVPAERLGTQIGPYRLLEQIGEGGMGVVYVAEQTEPVRRRVALKIIKPGMDTKQVIARVEAERQALAMMEHPNIARILDAGTVGQVASASGSWLEGETKPTPALATSTSHSSGRPYFVMELVRGMPITEYCDKAKLDPRKRLALFIDVCHAVQHAHQKGIIHRDLKPSNVMVTLHDGTPVVKVIDFGVAKAMGQSLTERTIYTAHAQLVGTPLYMSPEQAELSGLDVDTRSDVYSLGVLLYELLTGQTPFDKEALSKAGFDEMRRIIREDEPPRPSHRVSTLNAQAVSTVSQHRGLDERKLSQALRGELDWIVMKSLEKDRERRYESASALARDIKRFLDGELVQACPPSSLYRFSKFARRNKAAFTTAALIAASLLLGISLSVWQAIRATAAEAQAAAKEIEAKEEKTKALTLAAEESSQRRRAEAGEEKAERNLQAALMGVEQLLKRVSSPEMQHVPQARIVQRSMAQDAIDLYKRLGISAADSPAIRHQAATTWSQVGDLSHSVLERDVGRDAHENAISLMRQLVAEDANNLQYQESLAHALDRSGWFYGRVMHDDLIEIKRFEEGGEIFGRLARQAESVEARDRFLDWQTGTLIGAAFGLRRLNRRDEAIELCDRAISIGKRIEDPTSRRARLAYFLKAELVTKQSEKDALFHEALALHREWARQNPGHNTIQIRGGIASSQLGFAQRISHRLSAEAEAHFTEALEIHREYLREYPAIPRCRRQLADCLIAFARHHRWNAANQANTESSAQTALRLEAADSMFEEAIGLQRELAAEFPESTNAPGDPYGSPPQNVLLTSLQEQAAFLLGQLKPARPDGSEIGAATTKSGQVSLRKRRADALLTEATQLCRALAAEFPENAKYKTRLADLEKLQAQHFGQKPDAAKDAKP